MSVTWAGWAPAPEPDIDARLALSILPQFANEYLRQQSPEGQADLAFKQQQLELDRQRLAMAQAAAGRAAESHGLQMEEGRFGLGQKQAAAPTELALLQMGIPRGEAELERVGAETQRTRAATPTPDDLMLGRAERERKINESMAQEEERGALAGLRKKQTQKLEGDIDEELKTRKGKTDFLTWDGLTAPTLEGKEFAAEVYDKVLAKFAQASATVARATQSQQSSLLYALGKGEADAVTEPPPSEEVMTARHTLLLMRGQLMKLSKYLGVSEEDLRQQVETEKQTMLGATPLSALKPEDIQKAEAGIQRDPNKFWRLVYEAKTRK